MGWLRLSLPWIRGLPAERTLRKAGNLIPLSPKAFDALLIFLKNAGRLVTKHKLMNELWPSLSVSEANLTNTIVSLRKILGRDAIRTVSKMGIDSNQL